MKRKTYTFKHVSKKDVYINISTFNWFMAIELLWAISKTPTKFTPSLNILIK